MSDEYRTVEIFVTHHSDGGCLSGEDLLVVESVTKRYGETLAVDGVSLRVGAGEVYALVGANGAGK